MDEMIYEEIEISEELDAVKREHIQYKFPTVTFTNKDKSNSRLLYFNRYATPLVPEYIKWYFSTNYVIGLPAKETECNVYKTWFSRSFMGQVSTVPRNLVREKALRPGVYRVYKYKDGFAIKRYERVKERD